MVTARRVSIVLLSIVLSSVLCVPAQAQSEKIVSNGVIAGVIVAAAAVVAVAVFLGIHYSKKRAIAGCVSSGANGLTLTDQKSKLVYALAGNTAGIKPGEQIKLQGKAAKSPDKILTWQGTRVIADLGTCQP